jgi:hypothetical protein
VQVPTSIFFFPVLSQIQIHLCVLLSPTNAKRFFWVVRGTTLTFSNAHVNKDLARCCHMIMHVITPRDSCRYVSKENAGIRRKWGRHSPYKCVAVDQSTRPSLRVLFVLLDTHWSAVMYTPVNWSQHCKAELAWYPSAVSASAARYAFQQQMLVHVCVCQS